MSKVFNRKWIKIVSSIVFSLVVVCISKVDAKTGKTGGASLKIEVGGRELGVGGTGCASSLDAISFCPNPAGLSGLEERELFAAHNKLSQGIRQNSLIYSHPILDGVLGVGANYYYLDGIEVRDVPTDE